MVGKRALEGGADVDAELFDEAQEARGRLYLPIRLKTGVERDSVIDDAAQQMRGIADRLLEAFPGR